MKTLLITATSAFTLLCSHAFAADDFDKKAAAKKIDSLVNAGLKKHKQKQLKHKTHT